MSLFAGFRRMRALFSLMAVLVLFLGVSAAFLAMQQKELLHDIERADGLKELALIGTLAREALIKRDYVTVVQFFQSWGMDNPEIAAIEAVAENGYSLAKYEKEGAAASPFEVSRDIYHNGRKLIAIRMVKDHSEVDSRLNVLFLQGAAAFIVFTVAMGAALWFTLRSTAIIPMEEMVEEIRELNQGLEARVEKRTTELVEANKALKLEMQERRRAEEDLLRSKEELEVQNAELKKLDVLKDALVRDISHELKTPVAKHLMQIEILGDILARKDVFASVKDVLQVMEVGIRRQQAAIGNILLMSRLEKGGRGLNAQPFRLDALLEEVANDYLHAIATYGIKLEMKMNPVMLVSDRELLWHVFGNIVDNAIKYRSPEDALLSIEVAENGGKALVKISDNGVGLSSEERENAFQRFYQSSSSVEGLGLGLNIARTIIESLQGSITIESEGKNEGAVVSVDLPAAERESQDPACQNGGEIS